MKKFVIIISLVFIASQFATVYHERKLQEYLGEDTEILDYTRLDSVYSPWFDYMEGNRPDTNHIPNSKGEYVEYEENGIRRGIIIYYKDGKPHHTSLDNLRLYYDLNK